MEIETGDSKNRYASWKAGESRAAPPPEQKPFREAAPAEQISRFQRIAELFSTSSPYQDFFGNVYKYTDRFKIEGRDAAQAAKVFETVRVALPFMQIVLECFRQIQHREAGHGDAKALEYSMSAITSYSGSSKLLVDKRLNTPELQNMFEWSLKAFIAGGEKIGRQVNISPGEVGILSSDMGYIIRKVNDYLH